MEVLLPFFSPVFYTCVVCAFYFTFFFLNWGGSVQHKESKSNQPWFLSSYLHLCTSLFFSLHSVVVSVLCVKRHSPVLASELRCNLRNILFSNVVIMKCHFRVPLVHILNCVQTVPSCSFCYSCVMNKVESYCWYSAAVWEDLYRVGLHFNLFIQLCHWAQLHMHYYYDHLIVNCDVFSIFTVFSVFMLWSHFYPCDLAPEVFFGGCLLPSFFVTFPFSACAP